MKHVAEWIGKRTTSPISIILLNVGFVATEEGLVCGGELGLEVGQRASTLTPDERLAEGLEASETHLLRPEGDLEGRGKHEDVVAGFEDTEHLHEGVIHHRECVFL